MNSKRTRAWAARFAESGDLDAAWHEIPTDDPPLEAILRSYVLRHALRLGEATIWGIMAREYAIADHLSGRISWLECGHRIAQSTAAIAEIMLREGLPVEDRFLNPMRNLSKIDPEGKNLEFAASLYSARSALLTLDFARAETLLNELIAQRPTVHKMQAPYLEIRAAIKSNLGDDAGALRDIETALLHTAASPTYTGVRRMTWIVPACEALGEHEMAASVLADIERAPVPEKTRTILMAVVDFYRERIAKRDGALTI